MPMMLEKILHWWLSPISGASIHEVETWMIWHARIMVLAWAILLPLGVIAARYYKVAKRQNWPVEVDNRAWWHMHLFLQYSGVALMLIGVALAWKEGPRATTAATWHVYLGWCVIVLGLMQVIGGLLRGSKGGPTDAQMRGDHYDMTPRRLKFEALHKTCGWTAVLAAIATVCLGLVAADAPRWMALVLSVWWLALAVFSIKMQRAGRCVDTYQAIWGPDPVHPGNQRQHIGWGMRRPSVNREKA
jgi:hypothetical protein